MKYRAFTACASLCVSMMLVWSCNNDQQKPNPNRRIIPLDEARARRSIIGIDTAMQYQQRFVQTRSALRDTAFLSRNFNIPNAESFSRDAIILLLNQQGADGIRVYYGKDNQGKIRLVLLPIDSAGKNIKTKLVSTQTALQVPGDSSAHAQRSGDDAEAIEKGQTCPPCEIAQ